MIFVFNNAICDLNIIYVDALMFEFISDIYRVLIGYWSIEHGGHQMYNKNYRNNQYHGTQYGWYSIQEGGHLSYIENYKNNKPHGAQYSWYAIQEGGHLHCVENYQNNSLHGIQQYWRPDKSYYTESY